MAMSDGLKLTIILGFLAIIAVGAGINVPILSDLMGATEGPSGGGQDIQVTVNEPDKACGSTTMFVDFDKKYSSTDVTAYNATVYIGGQKYGVVSEGSSFTAQGGKDLDVYYALDPANNDYYASHASGKIPCTGQTASFLTSDILSAGSLAGTLQDPADKVYYAATAATVSGPYNKKTLVSLGTTALAMGAGSTEIARVYLDWANEEGYGVADGNTLACRFTDSQIDQSKTFAILDGVQLGVAKYVPSTTRFALTAANQSAKYWAFPAIDGKTTRSSTLDIEIRGDETNQPTGATNMSCVILDTDLFDTDDGEIKVGVEDSDDNSNVGRSTEAVQFNIALS